MSTMNNNAPTKTIYLHFEPSSSSSSLTNQQHLGKELSATTARYVLPTTSASTSTSPFSIVNDVLSDFVSSHLGLGFPPSSTSTSFQIARYDDDQKAPIDLAAPIERFVSTMCTDGDDFIVLIVPESEKEVDDAPTPTPSPQSTTTSASSVPSVLEAVESAVSSKKFALALSLYSELLLILPQQNGEAAIHVHVRRANIFEKIGLLDKAQHEYEVALERCFQDDDNTNSNITNHGPRSELCVVFAIFLLKLEQYDRALSVLERIDDDQRAVIQCSKEYIVCIGAVYYHLGNKKDGADLITAVLKKDPEYTFALQRYGIIYAEQGYPVDAISLAVRLLISNTTSEELKEYFLKIFRIVSVRGDGGSDSNSSVGRGGAGGGMQYILTALLGTPDSARSKTLDELQALAEGIAFLANVLKSGGEVATAANLFLWCSDTLQTRNAHYCLNYMHALEAQAEAESAIKFGLDFLEHNKEWLLLGSENNNNNNNNNNYDALYLCGDSHSVAPSWRPVPGTKWFIHNALVTGLKCWHLRPDSHFYPKLQFLNVTSKVIPTGANVVFLFGEIDCREGILRAVEKGVYSSVEDGMCAVIDIYLKALIEVSRSRGFDFAVHPPLPTMAITSSLVHTFNIILKAKCKDKGVRFLDIVPRVVKEATPTILRDDLQLDGVHTHPNYLSELGEAMKDVDWTEKKQ
eukprot:PhM_4_TR2825/c1_g1_i2/m.33165